MEKERYTIESFEIDEPSCIFDNKTQQRILSLVEYNYDEIVNLEDLLNQKDAKIKELEKENQQLKEELKAETAEKEFWHSAYKGKQQDYDIVYAELRKTFDETDQLKQSQNEKVIEVLQQAKIEFETYYADNICNYPEWIDSQIKELKEKK